MQSKSRRFSSAKFSAVALAVAALMSGSAAMADTLAGTDANDVYVQPNNDGGSSGGFSVQKCTTGSTNCDTYNEVFRADTSSYFNSNLTVYGNQQVTGTLSTGTLSTNSLSTNSVTTSGTVSAGSVSSSGTVSAASVSTGSVTSTGTVSAASVSTGSVTSTGTVSAASVSTGSVSSTGAVSAASVTSTGDVSGSTLTSTGAASVGGNLAVAGTTTTSGIANTGNIATSTLSTTSHATVGGDLSVAGQANTAGITNAGAISTATLNTTGAAAVGSNLAVAGDAAVNGGLAVQGASTLNGATTVNNTFSANAGGGSLNAGAASVSAVSANGKNSVTVSDGQVIDGVSYGTVVEGNAYVNGNLTVNGYLTSANPNASSGIKVNNTGMEVNGASATASIVADRDAVASNGQGALRVTETAASLTVVNAQGNTHGIAVGTEQTVISGGAHSTNMVINDNGVALSNMQTGAPVSLTGVADGVNRYDAVNKGQLDRVEREAARGIASVAALAAIPEPAAGKKYSVGAGTSIYSGYSAIAFGFKGVVRENVRVNVGVSTVNGSRAVMNAGVGFSW